MSRILELVLCALLPIVVSAFSVPRDITPDDDLNTTLEARLLDDEDEATIADPVVQEERRDGASDRTA